MNDNLGKPNSIDDEIDLGFIFKAIGNFFKGLFRAILSVLLFISNHKIRLLIILFIGGAVGYILDLNHKQSYQSNFIVSSAYNSADYVYNKIEAIDRKISQNDTIFLKKVFGNGYKLVKTIEAEPIVEIYKFIAISESNADLFELLAEDENKADFLNEPVNSMNYTYHKVRVSILGKELHQDITKNFFSFINSNEYLSKVKNIHVKKANEQIQQNNFAIKQIDSLISSIISSNNSKEEGKSLVRINENSQFDDLFTRRRYLLTNSRTLEELLINNSTVTIVDANYAVTYDRTLSESRRIVLIPILFSTMYMLFFLFRHLNNKFKRLI